MNIEGLLSVTSKVGTPLALAGIIVIVLYALYKQVLALKHAFYRMCSISFFGWPSSHSYWASPVTS